MTLCRMGSIPITRRPSLFYNSYKGKFLSFDLPMSVLQAVTLRQLYYIRAVLLYIFE